MRRSIGITAAICLLTAGCGGSAGTTSTTGAAAPTTTAPTTTAPTTTTIPREARDASLVAAVFEDLNAAAGEGPGAAAAALIDASHPELRPVEDHCLHEYAEIGSRTFHPLMETLAADPGWAPPGSDAELGGRIYSIRVEVTDGEGGDATTAVRRLHVVVEGEQAHVYMACAVPPPPTTTTTTTTIPLPALTVAGGTVVDRVRREVVEDSEASGAGLSARLWRLLHSMGVDAEDTADAVLTAEVTSTARGQGYDPGGTCYTGARTTGTVTLALPDGTTLSERVSGEVPMPAVTFGCPDESGAPHEWAFEQAMIGALVAFWGEGAVPMLHEIVSRDIENSTYDLPNKKEALDAFRSLDHDLIHPAVLADFAGAAIGLLDILVEKGWTDHGAKSAARRFLTTLSGEDYGASGEEDVAEWRAWLEDWSAGTGG